MMKKIIDRLSTHYQLFYGFSLIKVFFLAIMSLTLTFTFMHMCMITLSASIFLNKGQKFLHFFLQISYKTVY